MGARHHSGLRVRSTLAWAAGALLLSVSLSLVAYQLVRSQLVEERQDRATAQSYVNARAVRNTLRTTDPDLNTVLGSLGGNAGSVTLAWVDGQWFAGSVGAGPAMLPSGLTTAVSEGDAGSQITDIDGVPHVVTGVPIAELGARYFEMVSLEDVDAALSRLARGLTVAATVATVAGAVAGWYVSRRVLRPVRRMAEAATEIADGHLDARLDALGDEDLRPLQESFNHMADAVQERIERERRFASDVSHELRSPLSAMMSSIQVARRRADDPVAVDLALDDLEERADAFRALVLDLLEISRLDAGVADFSPEPVTPEDLVRAVLVATGNEDVPVTVTASAPTLLWADKRRLGQVLQNLVENAARYAGGTTRLGIAGDAGSLVLTVDDEGPGVAPHERTHIFNRFARGEAGALTTEGSGLGLALVAEHVRLHGGSISVTANPCGQGARFVVSLPVGSPPDGEAP